MSLQEFIPLLVGMKYDLFAKLEEHHKNDITSKARKFAKKMRAISLIYCSALEAVNVKRIFKVIVTKIFDLKPVRKEILQPIKEIYAKEKKEKKAKKEKKEQKKSSDSLVYPFTNFQSLIFSAIEPYHHDKNQKDDLDDDLRSINWIHIDRPIDWSCTESVGNIKELITELLSAANKKRGIRESDLHSMFTFPSSNEIIFALRFGLLSTLCDIHIDRFGRRTYHYRKHHHHKRERSKKKRKE